MSSRIALSTVSSYLKKVKQQQNNSMAFVTEIEILKFIRNHRIFQSTSIINCISYFSTNWLFCHMPDCFWMDGILYVCVYTYICIYTHLSHTHTNVWGLSCFYSDRIYISGSWPQVLAILCQLNPPWYWNHLKLAFCPNESWFTIPLNYCSNSEPKDWCFFLSSCS